MLLSTPNSNDVDLSKLKMVIGGAALSKSLAKTAMQRGINIFAGHGMSELSPILTIAQLREYELTGNPDERSTCGPRPARRSPSSTSALSMTT